MGRKTIEEVLKESIEMLGSNNRILKIRAAKTVQLELSMIKGFDSQIIVLMRGYAEWMVKRYQTVFAVGIKKRLVDLWEAMTMKIFMLKILNMCEKKNYGDGDKYLKEILSLIRKDIQ